jgi:hypothetical protein
VTISRAEPSRFGGLMGIETFSPVLADSAVAGLGIGAIVMKTVLGAGSRRARSAPLSFLTFNQKGRRSVQAHFLKTLAGILGRIRLFLAE